MFTGLHVGRSWEGTAIEDACPCPKAPCGLVDTSALPLPTCEQHNPVHAAAAKTMRQIHAAEMCPGSRAEPESRPRHSHVFRAVPGESLLWTCDCGETKRARPATASAALRRSQHPTRPNTRA